MAKNESFVSQDLARVASGIDEASVAALEGSCITVTGASGFMGMWLTELLLYIAHTQKIKFKLNLLAASFDLAREQAPHLYEANENVTLIGGDIKSIHELPPQTQWLVHAAASPDVRVHNSQPIFASQTIAQGTHAVLDCATRLADLKGFLNISSGYVQGFHADNSLIDEKVFEGFDPSVFAAAYAEAKRYAESLCTIYRNQFRLPLMNVRPFSFVGPYQALDAPWAVNNFILDVVKAQPIRVQGDGSAVRSYMYGADMAWWLLNILLRGDSGKTYNVGSSKALTLKELAEKIKHLSGDQSEIKYSRAALKSKASVFVPSTQKVEKELGLKMVYDLDQALSRSIQWVSRG